MSKIIHFKAIFDNNCSNERLRRQCNINIYIVDIQIINESEQKHYERQIEYVAY